MLITSALITSAVLAIGFKMTSKKDRKAGRVVGKRLEPPQSSRKRTTIGDGVSRALIKIDDRYQRAVQTHLDPLLSSSARDRQVQEMGGSLTRSEAATNRELAVMTGSVALGMAGHLAAVPLLVAFSALLNMVVMIPIFTKFAYRTVSEKRLKYRLVGATAAPIAIYVGFPVTGALMMLFVIFAEKLSRRTESAARRAMSDAFSLETPATVWRLHDGLEIETDFDRLAVGDIIVVRAGQIIPIDGSIVSGAGLVDQRSMTGEPHPVEKMAPDAALSNTLLLSGELRILVERTGSDTAASRIIAILDRASNGKLNATAKSEALIDKMAWGMIGATATAAFAISPAAAATILNGSSFGTGIIVSGPLSMLSYLRIASERGILVKDGRSLEQLGHITAIVFDKTGTLTLEEPEVGHVYCGEGHEPREILALAAIAEYRQPHPIARAIVKAALQQGVEVTDVGVANYELGMGIKVRMQDRTILVGNKRFLATEQIVLAEECPEWAQETEELGESLVYVALNGACIGAIRLTPRLRRGAEALFKDLRQRGLKTYLLSGDADTPTRRLAEHLQADGYFAEVLPDDKARLIKTLQEQGERVCFVGDGVNDALALNQADVSVSMRGAASIATDNADIILMHASLTPLSDLIEIGRDFEANLKRMLALSYVPGGLLITGVFLAGFGMTAGLVIYTTSLVASVGNAFTPRLTLQRMKSPK